MSSKMYDRKFLKGASTYRVVPEVEPQVIESYFSALDCPRSLTAWLLYNSGEHGQLADLECNPSSYLTYEDARDSYAATKFLSKFSGLSTGLDLDKVAMAKFDSFELSCKETNRRFRSLSNDSLYTGAIVWLHNAIIRKIDRVLGSYSAKEFFSMPDWGPGASTLIKRRDASPVTKFQREVGITRDLLDFFPREVLEDHFGPLWLSQLKASGFPVLQVGNKVVTVPKDATTNRVIAIEPGINLWFQKSVGEMIGRRLRRVGVDLHDQTRNQRLAFESSLSDKNATVDLKSASDSISTSVVEALLPPRWFVLLDACRSQYGLREGSWRKWEKFSSSGNGFTFPLESLIFYAAALCCTEYHHVETSDVGVYGDDVVLPTRCLSLFAEVLTFYGFQINLKKSHYDSPFRESCGAHYYLGRDIKPFYLKDKISSVQTMYRTANGIRRQAHRFSDELACDARFRAPFELLLSRCPKALRLRIPASIGDGGFIANFDEATPVRARDWVLHKKGGEIYFPYLHWEGYFVFNLVEASETRYDESLGYLIAELWRLSRSRRKILPPWTRTKLKATDVPDILPTILGYNSVPRKEGKVIRVARSLVEQWYDLGPWV